MSKVFIIPDVHLKPWMFEQATELASKASYDAVVMIGDLVDDWDQGMNLDLYNKTFDAAISFVRKHNNTLFCYGNHDVSYVWQAMETGYSYYARETVVTRLKELEQALPSNHAKFIHRIDGVLFSHAGLTNSFMYEHFKSNDANIDNVLYKINRMGKDELWKDNSPIWARPQYGEMKIYSKYYQVVGHTPVKYPLDEENILTLDNFSTYSNGESIGDEKFVYIDTEEKTWNYVN